MYTRSMKTIYLSLVHTGSWGYLLNEIPIVDHLWPYLVEAIFMCIVSCPEIGQGARDEILAVFTPIVKLPTYIFRLQMKMRLIHLTSVYWLTHSPVRILLLYLIWSLSPGSGLVNYSTQKTPATFLWLIPGFSF